MTECGICCEKYNKSYRVKIQCQYCDHEACRECLTKWVLSDSTPRCMNNSCNKEWTRKFMTSVFTGVFMNNDYKKHKEQVMFEREQALLPATQPIVENMIRCDKLAVEISEIEREISEKYTQVNKLRGQKSRLERGLGDVAKTERSTFIKACLDSTCRGFMSSQWKCGICEKWACPDCHEIKGLSRDSPHECNPDNVATAALIARDTKSCPSCGTGIHKLDGCDQMFCTMCQTGFSWKTGRIETNVHNPHYFEWLRRTGANLDRNPNEIICGREITHQLARNIMRELRNDGNYTPEISERVTQICEAIIHLRHVVMDRYATDPILNNQDLRVAYLRNKISKDELKIRLQRDDKKHQKSREIHNVFTMLVNTVTDIVYRFHNDILTKSGHGADTLAEVDQIVTYSNECFSEISKIWGSKLITINPNLRIIR